MRPCPVFPIPRLPRLAQIIWILFTISASVLTVGSPAVAVSLHDADGLTFRWIHPASDPQLWKEIQSSFHDELAPDVASEGQDPLDVYRHKYLQKVGIINHSALVFVGHRPANDLTKENEWDEYSSAFNFDITTRQKAKIEHAEWMWKLKFRALVIFGPARVPDVTFTYLTCTECEPDFILGALRFDPKNSMWRVRSWGNGKDPWWAATDGLVVGMDVNNGGDTISFDCVYGILNAKEPGFNDIAIRCKEVAYRDSGRVKIDDTTMIYGSSGGGFESHKVTEFSEIAKLNATICRQSPKSLLCDLPFYLTATAGQNSALNEMFPNPAKTARDLSKFRSVTPKMSMVDVVSRCGEPDELGGSGINIFIYHLNDGSLVVVGATNTTDPILYMKHIEANGKAAPLVQK
jgi:hypothetical protein